MAARRTSIRGIQYQGKTYVLFNDVFVYLATIGEFPNLNDSQRELISALIKDLRASTVGDVVGEDE